MVIKVQCEKCGTKYKLDESRVKGRGARITCPTCQHVFVVYREALVPPDYDEDEPVTIAGGAAYDPAVLAAMARSSGEATTQPSTSPDLKPRIPSGPFVPPGVTSRSADVSRPAAPPAPVPSTPAAPAAPVDDFERPRSVDGLNWREVGLVAFKVKVAIGLVYDFSDVGTLKKYLADKKVQSTDKLSMDGRTWIGLNEIPDLDTWFINQWVELRRKMGKPGGKASNSPATSAPTGGASSPSWTSSALGLSPAPPQRRGEDLVSTSSMVQLEDHGSRKSTESALNLGADLFDGVTDEGEPATPSPQQVSRAPVVAPEVPRAPVVKAAVAAPAARPMTGQERVILMVLVVVALALGGAVMAGTGRTSVTSVAAKSGVASVRTEAKLFYPRSLAGVPALEEGASPGEVEKVAAVAPAVNTPREDVAGENSRPKVASPQSKTQGVTRVAESSAQDFIDLGDASMSSKDYAGAASAYRQAVGMKPGNGSWQARLGHAMLLNGQAKEAIGPLKQAVKLAPKQADPWRWLGDAYTRAGQAAEAKAAYKKYLDLAPSAPDAEEIRSRIGG